mgnify:CR=1 FL=1
MDLAKFIAIIISIFAIAVIMSMVGRGGGNFYTPLLILAGLSIHKAACTSQFILTVAALAAAGIFYKKRFIDWKLALIIDPPTDIMAFVGGVFSGYFNTAFLKVILAGLLLLASYFMFIEVSEKRLGYLRSKKGFWFWRRHYGEYDYTVDLRYALPITALTGLFAGMVGISGGSFKIPMMVLLCGVPMRIAVGTSSLMIGLTAFMGFLGHFVAGHFDWRTALPVAIAGLVGGIIGGKISVQISANKLKKIFGITTAIAGLLMVWKTFQ